MSGAVQVVRPENARVIHWLGSRMSFLATSAETGGAFALAVDEPPAGEGPAPHVHSREDELFYALESDFTFWSAGQTFSGGPGAFAGLPRGLGHQFRNAGKGPSRVAIFLVPGGGEGFFLEVGNPISEPNDATVPPDPKRLAATAAKYGQTIAAPTLLHPAPGPSSVDLPLGVGRAPTLRAPGEGDAFAADGVLLTLKLVAAQSLGASSVTEVEIAPGAAFPAHRHEGFTEGLYVVAGEVSVDPGDPSLVAPEGSAVVIPPGASHHILNRGTRPARVLSLATPAGVEGLYRAALRPVNTRPAAPAPDPSAAERLARLGPRFGVEFAAGGSSG